jgi:hypothetical protein
VENVEENNNRYWTFPTDYEERIIDIVTQAAETRRSQIAGEE